MSSEMPATPGRTGYAPGVGFYAATLALTVSMLLLSATASFMCLMVAVFLGIALLGMAIGWLILAAITVFRTRLRIERGAWARWLGFPAILVLCLAMLGMSIPLRVRFELSRGAFQEAANRIEAGELVDGGNYGLFHIDAVSRLSNGVWFEDHSIGFIDPCGIAYSSTGRPDIQFLDTDLGGGWWLACEDF